VQEQDHLAIRIALVHVMPSDALHHPILMIKPGVNGIVPGLEIVPKMLILFRQLICPDRCINPDKSCQEKAESP
jgi:hypothetical protein